MASTWLEGTIVDGVGVVGDVGIGVVRSSGVLSLIVAFDAPSHCVSMGAVVAGTIAVLKGLGWRVVCVNQAKMDNRISSGSDNDDDDHDDMAMECNKQAGDVHQ
jgi:hypothetical protein